MEKFKLGDRVVRSKGDYVVGRTGTIVDEKANISLDMNAKIQHVTERVQVDWDEDSTTWVNVKSIELESVPYRIEYFTEANRSRKTGRIPYPKYHKL